MSKKNKKNLFGNKYVNILEGKLQIGNFDVLKLDKLSNLPKFVYILDKVQDNISKISYCFKSLFPESYGFYSVKANYLSSIVNVVRDSKFGAEIISDVELDILKKNGFPMSKVIAGGPYLPEEYLDAFIESNVEYIVIYCLKDLKRIVEILNSKNIKDAQKILVRFRSPKYTSRHGIPLNKEKIKELDNIFSKTDVIEFKGILSHMGNRMKSITNFQENFDHIIKIIDTLYSETSLFPKIIDIGGGFPNADSIKNKDFISHLSLFKGKLSKYTDKNFTIFYEPGRFIVGDIGFCISNVYQVDFENNTIFLNVGNNFIPKFMKTALRFYNASQINENPNKPFDFMGNIPSDQDILVKNYNSVPSTKESDVFLIANVGAYSLTWSTRFPYSFPEIYILKDTEIFQLNENSIIKVSF